VTQVTISSKYQVVIPKDVRERLGIRPGQKVEAFAVGGRIELAGRRAELSAHAVSRLEGGGTPWPDC